MPTRSLALLTLVLCGMMVVVLIALSSGGPPPAPPSAEPSAPPPPSPAVKPAQHAEPEVVDALAAAGAP
jgi:hypothetical protein